MGHTVSANASRVLNLLLPGGGMIAVGAVWRGLLVGAAFTVLLNVAIIFGLIIPDATPPQSHFYVMCVAATAVVYIGAQVWLNRVLHQRDRMHAHAARHELLREIAALLAAGDAGGAIERLRPHEALCESDLLFAYRLAQAMHAAARGQPAESSATAHGAVRVAWLRVRRLDAHRLYRAEVDAALAEISGGA